MTLPGNARVTVGKLGTSPAT